MRDYVCKLCGKVFYPKVVRKTIFGKEVTISAKSQLKYHLFKEHGKKSLKKKYCKKVKW